MNRLEQVALIATFMGFSWLGMQAVHEFGHVLGAWGSGGEVVKVALHPCIISRTEVGRNPHPLIELWAGPVIGCVLPLGAFLAARALHSPGVYLFRFFAGFCLIANGVYIALGQSAPGSDSEVMLLYGSPRWLLVLFGLLTAPLGLYLWHRQGPHFGLGEAHGKVSRGATLVSAVLLLATVGIELIFNSR
jgi:hypothetical protein